MSSPNIKVIALSNVFSRLMHFEKKGDIEEGHKHTYDHATLVSTGSVLVEMLDDNGNIIASNTFKAPTMIYIAKEHYHRLTALEDNTVCSCIHAIRTVDEEIVPPEFLIEPLTWDGKKGPLRRIINDKLNIDMLPFTTDRCN